MSILNRPFFILGALLGLFLVIQCSLAKEEEIQREQRVDREGERDHERELHDERDQRERERDKLRERKHSNEDKKEDVVIIKKEKTIGRKDLGRKSRNIRRRRYAYPTASDAATTYTPPSGTYTPPAPYTPGPNAPSGPYPPGGPYPPSGSYPPGGPYPPYTGNPPDYKCECPPQPAPPPCEKNDKPLVSKKPCTCDKRRDHHPSGCTITNCVPGDNGRSDNAPGEPPYTCKCVTGATNGDNCVATMTVVQAGTLDFLGLAQLAGINSNAASLLGVNALGLKALGTKDNSKLFATLPGDNSGLGGADVLGAAPGLLGGLGGTSSLGNLLSPGSLGPLDSGAGLLDLGLMNGNGLLDTNSPLGVLNNLSPSQTASLLDVMALNDMTGSNVAGSNPQIVELIQPASQLFSFVPQQQLEPQQVVLETVQQPQKTQGLNEQQINMLKLMMAMQQLKNAQQ